VEVMVKQCISKTCASAYYAQAGGVARDMEQGKEETKGIMI